MKTSKVSHFKGQHGPTILNEKSRFNRRRFLGCTASGLVGLMNETGTFRVFGDSHVRPGNKLRIPPVWSDGEEIVISPEELTIWPGYKTSVFAINGSVPGPTIRLNRGDTFGARIVNRLPNEPLVIHWHGLLAPEAMDGHPAFQVNSGDSYRVKFPIQQRGATCWYHSHTDQRTAEQVYKGLAGFFIIDDPAYDLLGLPSEDHDIPMVISDWRSNPQRQFTYAPSMMDRMSGYLGDEILVNGTPEAWHAVDQGQYRFRLLNGSNARIYNLAFSDNRKFFIIGNDGGLLPDPVELNSAILAPGQRIEILVDFSNIPLGNSITLRSLGVPRDVGPLRLSQNTTFDVITFYIESTTGSIADISKDWPQIEMPPNFENLPERQFILNSFMMNHFINGKQYDLGRVDFEVIQGDWEIWEFNNLGTVYHPMHVHAAHFWILERQPNGTAFEDSGWRDTLLVAPGETVRVIIQFKAHTGVFLTHCHNLEHEDSGMMQNFRVIPSPDTKLKIHYEEGYCEISWSGNVIGQLESSIDLSSNLWNPVLETPEIIEDRYFLRIPVIGRKYFFRLVTDTP